MKRYVAKVAAVLLVLGLIGHGACEHCYASERPACHGGGQHGARHEHVPQPQGSDCSCVHHLCGVLQSSGTAISSGATKMALMPLIISVVATRAATPVRPLWRASPGSRSAPLYLAQRSLLI